MASTLDCIPPVDVYNVRSFSTPRPSETPLVSPHYAFDIPSNSLTQQSLPSEYFYGRPRGQDQPMIHEPAVACFTNVGSSWTHNNPVYPVPAPCELGSGLTLATGCMLDQSQTGAHIHSSLPPAASDYWQPSPATQLQMSHHGIHYQTSSSPYQTLPTQLLPSSSGEDYSISPLDVGTQYANDSREAKKVSDPGRAEAKRNMFLARNREAATRCRQKKRHWQADLEVQARELAAEQSTLSAEIKILRAELLRLKNLCLEHVGCDCVELREYLAVALGSAKPNTAIYTNASE